MAKTVISRISKMRDGYARRAAVRKELASAYLSPGQVSEIEAALSRSDAAGNWETMEVRRVLAATQRNLMSLSR
jgi:hypothetical protein